MSVLNTVAIDTPTMGSREIDAAAREGHRGASLYHVDAALLRSVRPRPCGAYPRCGWQYRSTSSDPGGHLLTGGLAELPVAW
jgi:hypothetical protein